MVPLRTQIFLKAPMVIGKYNLILLDQGWLEVIGGQGIYKRIYILFKSYERLYNIILSSFLLFILLFLFSIFFIIFSFLYIIYLSSLIISMTLKMLRWFYKSLSILYIIYSISYYFSFSY